MTNSHVSAPSAPDFTFCLPADCRDANYALLLADRHMRWFEDFDPYGVEFDDRAAVLLECAAALLRGTDFAFQLHGELCEALNEFEEDNQDSDLFNDGMNLLQDIGQYISDRRAQGIL